MGQGVLSSGESMKYGDFLYGKDIFRGTDAVMGTS